MVEFSEIEYEVEDQIATIYLSRTDKLNAFTGKMKDELCTALDRADADDAVRAIIVAGRGSAFCAGADLSAAGERFGLARDIRPEEHHDRGGILALRVFRCQKPTIAAINGAAVGVGLTMTLPMDIRVAATTAQLGFVFTRRGIVPESCSSWFLPRIVGISRAAEWCYSGRMLSPPEALEAGLLRSVHEPDELLPAARGIAQQFLEQSSAVAVALTRQMLWRMLGASDPLDAHVVDSRAMFLMGRSADAAEGVAAFTERRPPNFPLHVSSDLPDIW